MQKNFNWLDEYGTDLFEVNQYHERFSRIVEEMSQADDKAIIRRLREEMHFGWNDAYNTGVKEIDSEHKHLLKIIENIIEVNNGEFTCSVTAGLLDDVLDYARLHLGQAPRCCIFFCNGFLSICCTLTRRLGIIFKDSVGLFVTNSGSVFYASILFNFSICAVSRFLV
ncbi:MAG: hypothetical protein D3917_21195 [Candidatus Electrothrix sp. AX5]|nr:hypothetical protein [Candidatus Electrothrix sp. AX5]